MSSSSVPTATLDEKVPRDKVVLYAFDEARQKLEQAGAFEPFTVILAQEQLYVESHQGDSAVECFNSARRTVQQMADLADAYVFCYDGYVTLEDGVHDALVAERAAKDDELAEAFALVYTIEDGEADGALAFEEDVCGLGEASSLFSAEEFTPDALEVLDDDGSSGHVPGEVCGCC